MTIPQSFLLSDHILARLTRILDGLVVYPDAMRRNLDRMRGMVFSGQILLDLAARGVSREEAYRMVQSCAMRVWEQGTALRDELLAHEGIRAVLSREELDAAFDLEVQFRHLDHVFQRVFREDDE